MNKILILIIFLYFFVFCNLFSKKIDEFENWINDWDQQELNKIGFSIINVDESSDVLVEISMNKKKSILKIIINKKIEFKNFIQSINAAEEALNLGNSYIDNRGYGSILINEATLIFGTTDIVLILPEIEKMSLNWNIEKKLTLDITDRIKNKTIFRYDIKKRNFTYNIEYVDNIKIDTGIGDIFQGWDFYLERLFLTLQKGLKEGNMEETDFVKSALININNIKFTSKRQRSDYFYISIENHLAPVLLKKVTSDGSYYESRIDTKILTAFSIKNLGASKWIYKPFGVRVLNGIFADANITNIISSNGSSIFDILKIGPAIGFGFSIGVPMFRKDKENNQIIFINELTAFSFETIFNINLINNTDENDNLPLLVNVLFGLDLFPGYLAYVKFFLGISTDGNETGFTIGGKLVFDINLPKPKLKRRRDITY